MKMNIPNLLTLSRIIGSFFFFYFLTQENWKISWIIFVAAAFTDMIDGGIARLLGQRTRLGGFLDPAADKLLMFFGFFMLAWKGIMPLWITGVVVARDLLITLGIFIFIGKKLSFSYRPTYLSKLATFLQIVTLCCYLIDLYRMVPIEASHYSLGEGRLFWLTVATAAITVVTGIHYVRIGLRILHGKKA